MDSTPTPPRDRLDGATAIVGLATAPLLAGIWGAQTLMNATIELGRASEELFRGDRLPVLNFPSDRDRPD